MKATSVLIGVAVVAGGYLAWTQLKAKPQSSTPKNPTAPTSSGIKGFANNIGASLLSKISVALGGSSTWRGTKSGTQSETATPTSVGVIDLNQSSYSQLTPQRDSLSFAI